MIKDNTEILKKKEYLKFLTKQLFKLTAKNRVLERQLSRNNDLINNYLTEKSELLEWIKENDQLEKAIRNIKNK